ncbi:MAG: RNA polymerase sigma-54 factor [Candidatus Binatia bacterium]|nr:MAG: RNA polymerase sigma-54 factor [Candidatus Binatia bacterium]
MALETKLHQKLSQQLVMTPQLRQAIKILQISRAELEQLIDEELAENPVLEEGPEELRSDGAPEENREGDAEEFPEASAEGASEVRPDDGLGGIDWRDYLENYANDWQGAAGPLPEPEDDSRNALENLLVRSPSLTDYLLEQLRMQHLDEAEEAAVSLILGNLDKNGYLQSSTEDIAFQSRQDLEVVERALERVQSLDPPGVGARNLRECLLLQLRASGLEGSLADRIVREHLDLLEAKRYDRIARETGATVEEVVEAAHSIASLEPKPGRNFGEGDVRYITPDVYVHKVGDEYVVVLNEDGLPRLRVSSYYRRVLAQDGPAEAKRFIQEKLRSAQWLIKSIQQRQRTLYLVAQSIVKFQKDFLERGVAYLRPMVLKDVAADIGMHESTVSRATANKYMHTPQGIFELKYFFTSSLRSGDGRDEVSAESVKERIREIIAREDPRNPLSDQQIARILAGENVDIARRTVAKYRELMGILPSSKRRRS